MSVHIAIELIAHQAVILTGDIGARVNLCEYFLVCFCGLMSLSFKVIFIGPNKAEQAYPTIMEPDWRTVYKYKPAKSLVKARCTDTDGNIW